MSATPVPDRPPPLDWATILAQHEPWLRTVVYARVGDAADVEDVMQEVAMAAWAQQAPLLNPAKVAPWLYQLAVRQSLLHRRKCGRHRKLLQRYQDKVGDSRDSDDPLQWLLIRERADRVRQALFELSDADRELLLLKYTEKWSYRQLAEHIGVTESAVESRLHRARGKLRSRLTTLAGSDSRQAPAEPRH